MMRCVKYSDNNQELECIQTTLNTLQEVNYKDPKLNEKTVLFQELGNALGLYMGNWEGIVKDTLAKAYEKIKEV